MVQVPGAPFLAQLPVNAPDKATDQISSVLALATFKTEPCETYKPLALAWHSPGHCDHSCSEPADERLLYLLVTLFFKEINIFKINKILTYNRNYG